MCKSGADYHQCLKNHYRIHGCTAQYDGHKKEQPSQEAFNRVMPKAGGNIHIIIGMMNYMKAPEQRYFMLYDMHQPSSKKIKRKCRNNNGDPYAGMKPVHESETLRLAPVAQQDD